MLRVGIDVGGTNTDAAVLRGNDVLATTKVLTTSDVLAGCSAALAAALQEAAVTAGEVEAIMIGTTHFINALVTRRGLARCALLRLCGGATASLPPFVDLADGVRAEVGAYSALLPGGMHHDGTVISDVSPEATKAAVREATAAGVGAVVVSAVFSPVSARQEDEACTAVAEELQALGRPDILITKSSDVAGLGLLERENAAVLNAALRPLARCVVVAAQRAAKHCSCHRAALYLTQNDGTVIAGGEAVRLPIRCIQCGPVNSLRGAAMLAQVADGIVVDVGGTTTDVGAIVAGFPRPASRDAFIGGVRTNFPVPDVTSIGLGGGSHVQGAAVGPASVGKDLLSQSLAFAGPVCTATDVAIRLGRGPEGLGSAVQVAAVLQEEAAREAWQAIQAKVAQAVDRCKRSRGDVPVVLVGGGAFLVEDGLRGASQVLRPPHAASANAVGAAAAQVSGFVDVVVQLGDASDRAARLSALQARAVDRAIAAGADPGSVRVLEIEEIPLAYLPGCTCRVKVRAVGNLAHLQAGERDAEIQETAAMQLEEHLAPTEDGAAAEVPPPQRLAAGSPHIMPSRTMRVAAAREPQPGEWRVTAEEVDAITLGVGVLGTGGGGSPHQARLCLLRAMALHGPPTVVATEALSDDCVVFEGGYMGAPTVGVELLRNGQLSVAVHTLAAHVGRKPDAVISAEIGGGNGLEQLLLAVELGVLAVDGDLMGRAFPCLDHTTPAIYGLGVAPAALADHLGNTVIVPKVASPKWLEDILRPVCTAMGCTAGLSTRPLTGLEVKNVCIRGTVSKALQIGSAILAARQRHEDPVQAAATAGAGEVIFTGKIVDISRVTSAGFARGRVAIEAVGGALLEIDFQNENLIAVSGVRVVATTPELICLLETATGRPLQTEETRYGLLVSVLLLPAPKLLTTPEALAVVGPRGFGYDLEFVPYRQRTAPS